MALNVLHGRSRKPETGPDPVDPPSVLSLISPSSPKQFGMVSPELPRPELPRPELPRGMDELTRRFAGLLHYAKLVETVASGIGSGEIKVQK